MFPAGIAIDDPGSDRDRRLIRVAETVVAAEPVLAKQLPEGNVVLAGIKNRQIILILLGDVKIEDPRFKGLHGRQRREIEVAFEYEPAIQAHDRQGPARAIIRLCGVFEVKY